MSQARQLAPVGQAPAPAAAAPAMSGAERAAMVLRELGEDIAAAVLRQMDESAVTRISSVLTTMRMPPPEIRGQVMERFASDLGLYGGGGDNMKFLRRVLVSGLGDAQAREVLERLNRDDKRAPFRLPPNVDARTLATQMAHERPQTIALLLAHINPELAAGLLAYLPEALAAETLYRFSTLDAVSPNAVAELKEMLDEVMTSSGTGGRRLGNLGGPKQAADILNHLQTGMSDTVLGAIDTRDKAVGDKIRENLFTFTDLGKLSDRAMQILLREVPAERLAPALRIAEESLRSQFYKNLSTRQVEVLKEELSSGPPIRRVEALTAQREIVEVALRLSAEGRITVNATEEMV